MSDLDSADGLTHLLPFVTRTSGLTPDDVAEINQAFTDHAARLKCPAVGNASVIWKKDCCAHSPWYAVGVIQK